MSSFWLVGCRCLSHSRTLFQRWIFLQDGHPVGNYHIDLNHMILFLILFKFRSIFPVKPIGPPHRQQRQTEKTTNTSSILPSRCSHSVLFFSNTNHSRRMGSQQKWLGTNKLAWLSINRHQKSTLKKKSQVKHQSFESPCAPWNLALRKPWNLNQSGWLIVHVISRFCRGCSDFSLQP